MIKNTMIKALSLGLVLGLSTQVSFANGITPQEREANITFTPGGGGGPVEPPIVEPPVEPPLEGGPLDFRFLIESMNFGSAEISANELEIPMIAEGRTILNTDGNEVLVPYESFVMVTDERGVAEGWSVNATLSQFENVNDRDLTINGVSILLNNTSIREGNDTVGKNVGTIELNPDQATTVMSAQQSSTNMINALTSVWGDGIVNREGVLGEELNKDIILNIPAGAGVLAEDYTATITWAIENIVEQ